MSDAFTGVVRKVFGDQPGVFIEVGGDSECGLWPEIRTVGEKSVEYYGEIRLAMTPSVARAVGLALIACAEEMEKKS